MKYSNTTWNEDLETLILEVLASEKAYGTCVQSDRHPRKRPYFKKRHFKQQHFAHVLVDEFNVLTSRKLSGPSTTNAPVLTSFEKKLLEDTLTDREVDYLILEKEQELIVLYQRVLAHSGLPNTTNAILQSQAEEMNNMQQGLLLEYRIKLRTEPVNS